jgi:uncharacterized membrane protein YfcA
MAERIEARVTYPQRAVALVLAVVCVVAMFSSSSSHAMSQSRFPLALAEVLVLGAGLGIGCYGTLVGIGGGPLIVPVLVLCYGWPARNIVATALLVVFMNALSGTVGYSYQRRIDYQGGLKFALAGLPGAVLSGLVHRYWNIRSFDTIFGVFLVGLAIVCAVGARTVDERQGVTQGPIEAGHRLVSFRDRFGVDYRFGVNDRLGSSLNFGVGFLVGFLGIGGGVLQVPMLVYLLRYPVHVATATSHFITMLSCLYALAPNIAFGNVRFGQAFWMWTGVIVGAQTGAWLAARLRSQKIMYLFVALVMVFGLRLIWS